MALYLFYGPDTFSRSEALRDLKAQLDTDGSLATNTVVIEAQQSSPQEVMAACDTVPFLGPHRLVIVEGLLSQSGRARRGKRAQADDDAGAGRWQPLVDYIERMPESTVLVALDGEVPVKNTLLEVLAPRGTARHLGLKSQRDLPKWITERARSVGLKLEGGVVRLIADRVGVNYWLLANELEKLRAYANGRPVTEAEAKALVSDVREQQGYLLADAVAERRPALALRLLHHMLAQESSPPPVLLSTIAGRYRRLAIARELMDSGAPGNAIRQRLGAKEGYGFDKLLQQASAHSLPEIRAAYTRMVEAELEVKRGYYDYDLALELLVHDLALPRRRAA